MIPRIVLHSDLNSFYASVEALYNPELRNVPMAVTGDPELRHGIVLAKNQIAKKYGVQTGEPLHKARQKCPSIVFASAHYDLYLKFSKLARDIYANYTDQVEPFGLDECWLDVTGSCGIKGNGQAIADEIRTRIRDEMGITASVGVSFNKVFAKLGSDYKKPDATTEITQDNYRDIVWPLAVGDLLYVGIATQRKLRDAGIRTIGQLAAANIKWLQYKFGKVGVMLQHFALGNDFSLVAKCDSMPLIKSIGNSTTTPRDLVNDDDVSITLLILCESVAARLREQRFDATTVQIYIRDNELQGYERQARLRFPCSNSSALYTAAFDLYQRNRPDKPIRSIGVRACNLANQDVMQMCFLPDYAASQRHDLLEETIDDIRRRFGHFAIQRGIMLTDHTLSCLDPKADHIIHPVGFLG